MGKLSLKSGSPAKISSMCAVFAESEVVSLVAEGTQIFVALGAAVLACEKF